MSDDAWRNSYDEWKTASPYDYASPLDEARAEIRTLQDENDKLINALQECLDWFEDRQDADCDETGFIPNEEMKMAAMLKEILK